jgi:hypothetical protein
MNITEEDYMMKGITGTAVIIIALLLIVVGGFGYSQGWFGTGMQMLPGGCDPLVTPNLLRVNLFS